ncbi:MAG: DoxX family protein [Terriglobales bacterium]
MGSIATSRPIAKHSFEDQNSLVLAGLRIAVGLVFLIFCEFKLVSTRFILHGGFQAFINHFLEDGAYPFMVPVLRGFVLRFGTAFALLTTPGELGIATSLLLGIWTRVASIGAFVFMAALLFAADYPGTGSPLWQYVGLALRHLILAFCFLAFAVGDSERRLTIKSLTKLGRA